MNKQNFFSISDPKNDFTRDMYRDSNQTISMPQKKRPHVNELLPNNHRNDLRSKERLIRDLHEEIKGLKEKLSMVIEKDQEIYRLQCANDILERDISEYRSIKTDEALQEENKDLRDKIVACESNLEDIQSENITLKKKLIEVYRQKQSIVSQPTITDQMIGRYLRSLIYKNAQSPLIGIL